MAAQAVQQNYRELLSSDYINRTGNIQQGENKVLVWISDFLEEHGCDITQIGLTNTGQMNKNRNPINGTNMHKSDILFVKIHESEIPIHKLEKIDCRYLINLSKFSH